MNNTISDKEALTNMTINVSDLSLTIVFFSFINSIRLLCSKIFLYWQVFVNTVNNFVQKEKITVWEALPTDNRRTSLTKLMHTAEQATLLMSQNFKKTTQLDVNASEMGKKKKMNVSDTLDVNYTMKFFQYKLLRLK